MSNEAETTSPAASLCSEGTFLLSSSDTAAQGINRTEAYRPVTDDAQSCKPTVGRAQSQCGLGCTDDRGGPLPGSNT